VHVHQGNLFTGLSSVMILKLPTNYGVEYSAADKPQNGKLQLLGSSSGQFAKVDYQPILKERDFYVFPYDMRHCVYPFNSTTEVRRTLAANCDVHYKPNNESRSRMIEPYYQIFKEKLKEVKFKDMKILFPTVDKFVKEVNPDLEKNGLLCPIVLDKDGVTIRSGAHRYDILKTSMNQHMLRR
jgi:hypothetical protein